MTSVSCRWGGSMPLQWSQNARVAGNHRACVLAQHGAKKWATSRRTCPHYAEVTYHKKIAPLTRIIGAPMPADWGGGGSPDSCRGQQHTHVRGEKGGQTPWKPPLSSSSISSKAGPRDLIPSPATLEKARGSPFEKVDRSQDPPFLLHLPPHSVRPGGRAWQQSRQTSVWASRVTRPSRPAVGGLQASSPGAKMSASTSVR
jgi:hypothetical protein